MAKKRNSKLEGSVVDLIQSLTDNNSKMRDYFYWDSRFWKALRKYIEETIDKGQCAIPDLRVPKRHKLAYHRGTGSAISFRDAHAFAPNYDTKPPTPSDTFSLKFTVGFYSKDEEDGERECLCWIAVPKILEDDSLSAADFQKEFDRWIGGLSQKKTTNEREKELPLLKELMAKYPVEAQAYASENPNELKELVRRLNSVV